MPLLGSAPTFPWNEFTKVLSENLNLSNFSAESSDIQWRDVSSFFEGIANPVVHHLTINGIEGSLHWAMPREEITHLMTRLLTDTDEVNFAKDDELFASFHQFIAIETVHTISLINFDQNLSINLVDEANLPTDAALCVDVTINAFGKTIPGRLLMSKTFQQSWKQHYAPQSPHAYLSSPLSEKLDLTVHLEAGQTYLSRKEWTDVKAGDFVLLNNCWIDPKNQNGSVRLTINETPIFGGKVEGGQITIIETPPFQQVERQQEVQEVMVENSNNQKNDNFDDEDFDFDDEDFDDSAFDDDFDDSVFDETTSTEEQTELTDMDPTEDTSLEEEQPLEEKTLADESSPAAHAEQASEILAPEELPLSISVEVGRFQMSIKKLTELEPGNLLELGIRPENGVDLVINGRCIGRGELLRIGDTLGVRITEKS